MGCREAPSERSGRHPGNFMVKATTSASTRLRHSVATTKPARSTATTTASRLPTLRRSRSTLPLLLFLGSADALAPARTLAVAPASDTTGIAVLSVLRQLCGTSEYASMQVRAICSDDDQVDACRQAVCGTLCREGVASDLCAARFSSLQTSTALADGPRQRQELEAALEGVDTLVMLADVVHPTLSEIDGGEQVIMAPPRWSLETIRSHDSRTTLLEAAVAARVKHIVLHSALGASGQRRAAPVNTARMGGSEHLGLRRLLEEQLEAASREHGVRHTILQAAPYATLGQLAAREKRERELLGGQLTDADALPLPPLTSPECMARVAVEVAFGLPVGAEARATKLQSRYKRVTREVISRGPSLQSGTTC